MNQCALRTGLVGLFTFSVVGLSLGQLAVVDRGPHHAIWQRVSEHTTSYAKKYYVTNSYVELSTGKNYLKDNQWVPSVENIFILPSGFGVATQLQHKVIFAPNINTLGAIDCLTPDDKRLRSHVLGLAYTDKTTGRGVMIAEVKDSVGVIVGNNQVLYPDAFDSEGGFRADIRYTVSFAGLEQDIIIVESPPSPILYGILPENCRFEVYSEFVEAPEVVKSAVVLSGEADPVLRQAMAEPDLIEETLIFGAMRMGQGAAFRFGQNTEEPGVPMGKTWEQREGRQLLVERVDYTAVQGELDRLPDVARVPSPKKTLPLHGPFQKAAWASFLPAHPPKAHAVARKLRPKEMAQAHLPPQGFVLDYVTLNSSMTNYAFSGDVTYYISGHTYLYETTVLEAGTCIKFADGIDLNLMGPVDCRTSAFRPAYFVSKDDNSVGETISGSTGTPVGHYGRHSLACKSAASPYDLHDLRIRHATYGVSVWTPCQATISHVQIGEVDRAFAWQQNCVVNYRNFLIHDAVNAFYGTSASATNRAESGTIHRASNFILSTNSSPALTLTNCLLIAVTNKLAFNTGSNNETNLSDTGIFQTVGSGARYLASSSPYRNIGTTNINANLLAALRQRTTYPPLLLTNDVSSDTTLTPQAQRDTDAIDLGFHYVAADWLVGGLSVTGATLTVKGGATVLIDAANTNWGIRLDSGGTLLSDGDPVNLNRFVRTHAVQEVPAGSGTSAAPLFADTYPAPASAATLNLRFTDIPQIQKHFGFNQPIGQGTLATLILRDSQFRGGTNCLQPSITTQFMGWTNLLMENCGWLVNSNAATTLYLRNATFKGGVFDLYVASGSTWSVKDCIFDYTAVTNLGLGTLTNDYNGYLTNAARLTPNGANDVVLGTNTVNFQTGPLGSYYLPTNSLFIDAGSVTNAGFVGLWHFTTQTNQTKEAGTRLDFGFHYVAVDANGQPSDSDSDGFFDYLEDANGNGAVGDGDSDWNNANDIGFKVFITRPRDGSVIP